MAGLTLVATGHLSDDLTYNNKETTMSTNIHRTVKERHSSKSLNLGAVFARLSMKVALVAVVAVSGATALIVGPAFASQSFGTMNDSGGIFWRSAPNWSDAIAVVPSGFYPGTIVNISCYASGSTVPGSSNTMWVEATWAGGPGSGSGWMNEHFVNDGAPIDEAAPGIPACSSSSPAPTPAPAPDPSPLPPSLSAQIAEAWAMGQMSSDLDSGLCLTFVGSAWSAAGVNIRSGVSVSIGANTYPQDIWGHFTFGSTGTGTPPPGALVFYNAKPGKSITYSHVTLSVGGGLTISTADRVNEKAVHYETLAQHASSGAYNVYVGWWLP
jgi:hypothetical protein